MNLKTKLFKLYIASIRPSHDYASIFFDGCSAHDLKKTWKSTVNFTLFINPENPFIQKQVGKRYATKMVTMFKIHNGGAIPDKHENVSSYNTRNKHNYFIPRCRLELFRNLFYLIR